MSNEEEQEVFNEDIDDPIKEANWPKVLFYTYLQMLLLYGLFLAFTEAYLITTLYTLFVVVLGIIGVTAGAHRLWAHRTYNASTGLKIFLMICQTLVGQGSIYDWVLYHRLHHKHFATNLDPYNPSNGFFYSHFMCLIQKLTPEQKESEKEIDMSDMDADPVIMFQKKYYWLLYITVFMFLPSYIAYRYLGESLLCSGVVAGWLRYGLVLHWSWLIHSATVIFALKSGEKFPSDTNTVFLFYKTYWLQYHYLAPWDYQTGEYGKYGDDCTSAFIRVCAALNLATDLRTVNNKMVKDALYESVETKKAISECLLEAETNGNIPKDHFLQPAKYF